MLHFLQGATLDAHPELAGAMFRDRATQFCDRLGWAVTVDARGFERDQYDVLEPLYVIAADASGRHAGSLRLMPTTGRTMLAEHFSHLAPGVAARRDTWECTRFCVAEGAAPGTAAALMFGASEAGRQAGLTHALGVFDARMIRIYARLGWRPELLGTEGTGRDAISAGRWRFGADIHARLGVSAGIAPATVAAWYDRSMRRMALAA